MNKIRLMKQEDVRSVLFIQSECYLPITVEDEVTIRNRLSACSDTAWVAEDNGSVCAYLVAYHSDIGKITPLGGYFDISKKPNSLYIHDIAVSTRAKSKKIGTELVQLACEKALGEGLPYSSLVSVQGTQKFWQKLGYDVWEELSDTQTANLKTYQPPAYYMLKKLA